MKIKKVVVGKDHLQKALRLLNEPRYETGYCAVMTKEQLEALIVAVDRELSSGDKKHVSTEFHALGVFRMLRVLQPNKHLLWEICVAPNGDTIIYRGGSGYAG